MVSGFAVRNFRETWPLRSSHIRERSEEAFEDLKTLLAASGASLFTCRIGHFKDVPSLQII